MGTDPEPSTIATSVGALLQGWRERALLTQKNLADRTGLSVRTVRRLESDDTSRPQGATLRLLIDALDLNAAERTALAAAARGTSTLPAADNLGPRSPRSAADAVPRQLPAPPVGFTGRAAELTELDGVQDLAAVVITAIDGMAGIGKTALALQAAHRFSANYPDGQLFVDLHGHTEGVRPLEPGDALDRLLRGLGVPGEQIPRHLDDRAARYRSRLADRKMLILLDNAVSEAQVEPLLPGTPGCLVLITSRYQLAGLDHTHAMSLDLLPLHDAVSLFTRTVGERRSTGETPDAVADAVELCGRLPLAIRIAAARLQSRPGWSTAYLSERLRDHQHRLNELGAGGRSINAALHLSYQQLPLNQQFAYRALGSHPGTDIDAYAAAALTGSTLSGARRVVDRLLAANLLQEPGPGRYRFHDLVRAHAATIAESTGNEPERLSALTRLLDYYAHAASVATAIAYPFDRERRPDLPPTDTPIPDLPDPTSATAWLDSELPNLLATVHDATVHHTDDFGRADHIGHLSAFLRRHLRVTGRYIDAEVLHGLAVTAAEGAGSEAGALSALLDRGEARRLQGRHEHALSDATRALEIARVIDDAAGEALALRDLGVVHSHQGRYEPAAEHLAQALAIARRTGDQIRELEVLNSLGYVRLKQGRYQAGTEDLLEAQRIAHHTGNPHGELAALTGLAWAHRYQHRHEEARAAYAQSLEVARTIGNRNGQLGAMIGLGWGLRTEGRHSEAAGLYQQMLELARETGSRNFQLEAFQGMGRLQHAAGRPHDALVSHRRALDLAEELGQTGDEARAHDGIARAYLALQDADRARRHWRHALQILTDLGVDHVEDEETTVTTIRAVIDDLGRPARMPE